jgi:hypothetical protein
MVDCRRIVVTRRAWTRFLVGLAAQSFKNWRQFRNKRAVADSAAEAASASELRGFRLIARSNAIHSILLHPFGWDWEPERSWSFVSPDETLHS